MYGLLTVRLFGYEIFLAWDCVATNPGWEVIARDELGTEVQAGRIYLAYSRLMS